MKDKTLHWYRLEGDEALAALNSTSDGLGEEQAAGRLKEYGRNELTGKKQRGKLTILINQFTDVMILILVAAAIISFIAGEATDAFVILAIILGNALLGYIQEYRAEEAINKLKQMAAPFARVIRQNESKKLPAAELVPGDILTLEAGDIIPADVRLLEVNKFKVEEAALTGESVPTGKQNAALHQEDLMPADQLNMAFKSTSVVSGAATAVVTATGMHTEVGKIAKLLTGDTEPTPLQKKLSRFSKQLAIIILVICAIIFVMGLYRGEPAVQMFLMALSLAVAALPEALPAVITISLANGAARMVKQHALIRRLPAVETLGSVTYICSDKTGTLTQNKMTVERVKAIPDHDDMLFAAMVLNSEVKIKEGNKYTGDPTEVALVKYATEAGHDRDKVSATFSHEGSIPFDSERMLMTTLHKNEDRWIVFVKGAPTKVAGKLSNQKDARHWLEENRRWAGEGLRVLFYAFKILSTPPPELLPELLEKDLEMLGMTGMIDPPREEVIDAIKECHDAGIKTVMITGDQPLTAKSIAVRLGILQQEKAEILTGTELVKKKSEELEEVVIHTRVYARVSPKQKLDIVTSLQQKGQIVAMTGDGVNDAPSLKKADIGIAMGITGTDVSKEAAHMILLDDNFATIVKAVKEGRRIYNNIRKFIQYVLACNLGEILVLLLYPFLGLSTPLLPIHILWINLVTDGLPGLAIAREPAAHSIMKRPPRRPDEPIFTASFAIRIVATGVILAAAAIAAQFWAIDKGYSLAEQQTMVFTTLCFTQLGNAFVVRGENSLLRNKYLLAAVGLIITLQLLLIYIPALNGIFKTAPLVTIELLTVLIVSVLCTFILAGINKAVSRIFDKKQSE